MHIDTKLFVADISTVAVSACHGSPSAGVAAPQIDHRPTLDVGAVRAAAEAERTHALHERITNRLVAGLDDPRRIDRVRPVVVGRRHDTRLDGERSRMIAATISSYMRSVVSGSAMSCSIGNQLLSFFFQRPVTLLFMSADSEAGWDDEAGSRHQIHRRRPQAKNTLKSLTRRDRT